MAVARATLDVAVSLLLLAACASANASSTVSSDGIRFVQPFSITYAYADSHVIAFLSGHPELEAVEAFIQDRRGKRPFVRAILTRHDKSQIDYVNDHDEFVRRSKLIERETHETAIKVTTEPSDTGTGDQLTMRFATHRDEQVELRFVAASPPAAAFGGFTNPRGHAGTSSLPVMWRDASALVSSVSVSIGGSPVAVAPGPSRYDAYVTSGFRIGVLRASRQKLRVVDQPDNTDVGARWRFKAESGEITYRIVDVQDGAITIRGPREQVTGRIRDGRVEIERLRVGPRRPDRGLVLDLQPPGRFTIGLDGHPALVFGSYALEQHDRGRTWVLTPEQPEWAVPRTTRVQERASGSAVTSSVSFG